MPPNMSVSTSTPSPVSTRFMASPSRARQSSIESGRADAHGLALLEAADDPLRGAEQLLGELTVRGDDESDHRRAFLPGARVP